MGEKDALMAQYDDLERFADVEPGLKRLKETGHTMVVFSNGSPRMLNTLMDAAKVRPYFEGFVSVDEVRAYKPSPKVYQHVARRLGRPSGRSGSSPRTHSMTSGRRPPGCGPRGWIVPEGYSIRSACALRSSSGRSPSSRTPWRRGGGKSALRPFEKAWLSRRDSEL
jgi:hypothetical protein